MFKKLICTTIFSVLSLFAMEEKPKFEFWSILPEEIRQQILSQLINSSEFDINNFEIIEKNYKKFGQELKKTVNKKYNVCLSQTFNNYLRANLKTEEDVAKLSTSILNDFLNPNFRNILFGINKALLFSFINLLIQLDKFDINTQDNGGNTALMWACKNNCRAVVKLLIEKGADVNTRSKLGNNAIRWTSCPEIKKLLITEGAEEVKIAYLDEWTKDLYF